MSIEKELRQYSQWRMSLAANSSNPTAEDEIDPQEMENVEQWSNEIELRKDLWKYVEITVSSIDEWKKTFINKVRLSLSPSPSIEVKRRPIAFSPLSVQHPPSPGEDRMLDEDRRRFPGENLCRRSDHSPLDRLVGRFRTENRAAEEITQRSDDGEEKRRSTLSQSPSPSQTRSIGGVF